MKTLYEILELEMSASTKEIRTAYKRLAAKHHPDKGGNVVVFKEVKHAYEVLSDEKRREKYDSTGSCAVSNLEQQAISSFLTLYCSCAEAYSGGNLKTIMLMKLKEARRSPKAQKYSYARLCLNYKKQSKLFNIKPGINTDYIASVSKNKRLQLVKVWYEQRELLEVFKRVEVLVEQYDYEEPGLEKPMYARNYIITTSDI